MPNSSVLSKAESDRLQRIVKSVVARRRPLPPPVRVLVRRPPPPAAKSLIAPPRPPSFSEKTDDRLVQALLVVLQKRFAKAADAAVRLVEDRLRTIRPDVQVRAPEVHTTVQPAEIHVAAHLTTPEVQVHNEVRPTDVKVENHFTAPEVKVEHHVAAPQVEVHNAVAVPEVHVAPQIHLPETKVYNQVAVPEVKVTNQVPATEVKVHNEVKSPQVVVEVDMRPVADALDRLAQAVFDRPIDFRPTIEVVTPEVKVEALRRSIRRRVERDSDGRISGLVEEVDE